MTAPTPTFQTILGHLRQVTNAVTNAKSGLVAAKSELDRLSSTNLDKELIDNAIEQARTHIESAETPLSSATTSLTGTTEAAIAAASEAITADFLKSSYEEAGQLERYYGTTRITASVLLLTIAATIGVALLGAIHTIDATENAELVKRLRFGSIAIPIGIFAIMFYVNLYFEYWSNIANRVARYIEQLQILRIRDSKSFVNLVSTPGGHRAAAIRSVNRAQKSLGLQMITISVMAAILLLLPLIALDATGYLVVKWIPGSDEPFTKTCTFWVLAAIFLIAVLLLCVHTRQNVPEPGGTERISRRFTKKHFPSRLPEITLLEEPDWTLENLNTPVHLSAKNHVTKTDSGCVGRINVIEANFVFVFLAAALYVAVAIAANAAPLVNPNKDAKNIETVLKDIATKLGPSPKDGSSPTSLSEAVAGIAGKLTEINTVERDNGGQLKAIADELKTLTGKIEAVEKRLPKTFR